MPHFLLPGPTPLPGMDIPFIKAKSPILPQEIINLPDMRTALDSLFCSLEIEIEIFLFGKSCCSDHCHHFVYISCHWLCWTWKRKRYFNSFWKIIVPNELRKSFDGKTNWPPEVRDAECPFPFPYIYIRSDVMSLNTPIHHLKYVYQTLGIQMNSNERQELGKTWWSFFKGNSSEQHCKKAQCFMGSIRSLKMNPP